MTENDIKGNFLALRNVAKEIVGVDLADKEKQTAQMLVEAGMNLLEGLLIDINKIADAAQYLASHQKP